MTTINISIKTDLTIQSLDDAIFPGFCQSCGLQAEYQLDFKMDNRTIVIRLTCEEDLQKYYPTIWDILKIRKRWK